MTTQKSSLPAYLIPRMQDVIFAGIFMAVIGFGPRLFNLDGDLGRHITIGQYMMRNVEIPTRDIFSHTMNGSPLVPHEWLSQIAFGLTETLMGLNGPVFLSAVIIAVTFFIKYTEITQRGIFPIIAAFTVLWAAAASSIHWLARPHIFTFLFMAIWTRLLEDEAAARKQQSLFVFPLLMLIWANTHGAFIAGFVVWGAYFVEALLMYVLHRERREYVMRLAMIGAISFAVTFINPSGYQLWVTSVGYIRNSYLVSHTVEYMAPNFQVFSMWPFLFMLAYYLFSLHGRARIQLREAFLLTGWMIMAVFSMRNIPLFAIITLPFLAGLIQEQMQGFNWLKKQNMFIQQIESQLKGMLWPILLVMAVLFAYQKNIALDITREGNHFNSRVFPVEATDWLKTNPQQGNLFNSFIWGGYILYETWPEQRVFIDGQTDFYGEALTREYEKIITLSPGWETIFVKYDVRWAMIETNSALANNLIEQQQWKILYRDETAVILQK
jgi:hypothetical protein